MKRKPLNSVALISFLLMLESFYIAEKNSENVDGFRFGMACFGIVFGLIAWRSLSKYGLLIKSSR